MGLQEQETSGRSGLPKVPKRADLPVGPRADPPAAPPMGPFVDPPAATAAQKQQEKEMLRADAVKQNAAVSSGATPVSRPHAPAPPPPSSYKNALTGQHSRAAQGSAGAQPAAQPHPQPQLQTLAGHTGNPFAIDSVFYSSGGGGGGGSGAEPPVPESRASCQPPGMDWVHGTNAQQHAAGVQGSGQAEGMAMPLPSYKEKLMVDKSGSGSCRVAKPGSRMEDIGKSGSTR